MEHHGHGPFNICPNFIFFDSGSNRQQKQRQGGNRKQQPNGLCVAWSNSRTTWCNWKNQRFACVWRTINHVNFIVSRKHFAMATAQLQTFYHYKSSSKKCVPPWSRAKDTPFSRAIRLGAATHDLPETLTRWPALCRQIARNGNDHRIKHSICVFSTIHFDIYQLHYYALLDILFCIVSHVVWQTFGRASSWFPTQLLAFLLRTQICQCKCNLQFAVGGPSPAHASAKASSQPAN